MKVLFAVSSESISEAIIKRYQKEYKEILSYKNVYYFNAILKEIQKDKTYDRIIISEDLEPFSNNNYDTIDKFIFDKLDSISDEAQDSSGKETSIILICTDRRVKGNSILVKLFGIGVYNALLGNDRSMDEVCKLINKPRTKKEAKIYYRIDTDDVNYKAENENEVSEVEIQNILAHFKKLGRNTAKYSDSFNNIAGQYTDEQLKIIVNCLPINVKAVLETNCQRYQELMSVTGSIPSVKNSVSTTIEGTIKNEINERKIGQAGKITKPIVIPAAVRNAKNAGSPVVKKAPTAVPEQIEPQAKPAQRPVVRQAAVTAQAGAKIARPTAQTANVVKPANPAVKQKPVQAPAPKAEAIEEDLLPGFEDFEELEDVATVTPVNNIKSAEPTMLDDLGLDISLDMTDKTAEEEIGLPGFEDEIEEIEIPEIDEDPTEKRGRGRPRKTPVGGVEIKPKGKRGRPRKIVEELEEIDGSDDIMLPGFEDEIEDEISLPGFEAEVEEDVLPGFELEAEDEISLPGFEDEMEEEISLPGFEEVEEVEEDEISLPGFENEMEEEISLPGFEDEVEVDDENSLPGFEDEFEEYEEVVDEGDLLEDEFEEEYTDEVALPGLDDLDDIGTTDELPGFEDEYEEYEEYEEVEEESLIPGMEFEPEEDLLPGFDVTEETEEETLLPGMGFEDEDDSLEDLLPKSNKVVQNSNSLESIKPRVDYSMSSLNSLITKDKKIVTFIGTSKNGTSFLVNTLAALFSSLGINTAILDMTQNKNSYYIYTKNEEELRNIAYNSIEKLQNGYAEGIKVDKNLTVYTALPNDGKDYSNAEPILSTLVQNHSLVLIDCDYDTDLTYFASCQEMYLVQSMDILTIQPLTAFLREMKTKGILEPEKIRVVVNKELKVKSLSIKAIIGGLSYYNDPAMSFMTELFNKDIVKACTIPFDEIAYSKYLEGIVNCSISLNDYSKAKNFLSKLKVLGDMVYPLTSKQSYNRTTVDYSRNAFSNSMNDTLNKMKKNY